MVLQGSSSFIELLAAPSCFFHWFYCNCSSVLESLVISFMSLLWSTSGDLFGVVFIERVTSLGVICFLGSIQGVVFSYY